MNPILTVNQVKKSFRQGNDEILVLDHLSLSVQANEKVAILGPSGCGKSTLLSLLSGLDIADQGTVEVEGQNLALLNEDKLSRLRAEKIGIVFQQYHLMRNLTAAENVGLPLEIRGISSHAEKARLALKEVGLSDRTSHFPSEMSGGECQRVALARALISRPPLILADEPSGNLDQNTGKEVMDLLFHLCQEHSLSLVLVTHNRELAKYCDRSFLLQDGILAEFQP